MQRRTSTFILCTAVILMLTPVPVGSVNASAANDGISLVLKQQESNILSLELEFSKKNKGSLERTFSFLDWGPNGYATGFLISGGIALTAYHVVSGDLAITRRNCSVSKIRTSSMLRYMLMAARRRLSRLIKMRTWPSCQSAYH